MFPSIADQKMMEATPDTVGGYQQEVAVALRCSRKQPQRNGGEQCVSAFYDGAERQCHKDLTLQGIGELQ